MKRVLYIGDDYLAGTGMGLVSEFILGGIKDQCEVFHMAINYSRGLRPKTGFRTFTSVSKYPNDFQGYFSLGQKIATIRPDLIIAHNDIDVIMAYYYGVPEIEFEGCNPLKDVPLLVYPPLDTQVIPEEWKKLQEIGKGPFSEKGPTFLATCDWAATLLENAGFAMHPDRFMYEQNDKNIKPLNNIRELKKKWARDPDVDVFLVVSRNDDRKNIGNTVLFLDQLKAYCPKMYVVLKLTGTGQGAIQEADVPKMCPHLKDRLTILSQRLSPNDMNELYNIADFYVNLSRAEGWGHGPVSASILGKPSILTKLPVTDEILDGKYLSIKGNPFPRANGTRWIDPVLNNEVALDLARNMASGDLNKLAESAKSEVKKYEKVSVDPILKCIDVVEERRKFMYPKRKLKVMFCGDSPRLYTGYGTVLREFMTRLHKTGKYDLAAHGYVNNPNANKEIELPFPVYSTIDAAQDMGIKNQEQFQQMLEQDKLGFVTFDWAYEKFMPDVVVSVGDIWYAEHIASSVYRENFKHIHYLAIDGEYMPEYTKDGRGIIHPWKEMIKSFDKTVVFTEFGKTEVLKAYGSDLDLSIIPHGVDINTFKPLSKEKKLEIRKRLGIPENAFVIGTFSRNQIRKQFDVAAQAVAETIRREETIRENKQSKKQNRPIFWLPYCKWDDPQGWNLFHVMSGLSIRDGGQETLLNRAIRIPGIEVGTGYTSEQLNEFYNICDIHLLPYIGEGFALTVIESMAAGVVNVIPDFSAPPCYARGAAFLIEPSFYKNDMTTNIKHAYVKPETVANKIGYLYRNPNKLEEISQAAVDRCTAWTWDLAAAKWEPILDSITPTQIKLTVSAPIMKKITDYIDPADKFRILIVMPGMHEDLYYMTGIIDSLHKKYAQNDPSIYLATRPSLFQMFEGFDKIKKLIPYRDEYNNPALEGQLFQIQYLPATQINPSINWMHHGHGSHAAFAIARTCDVTLGKTYLPKKEAVGLEVIGDFVTIHPSFQFKWEKITSKIKLPVVQLGSYDGNDAIPGTVDGRRFSFPEQMDIISRAKCHIGSDNIFGQAAGYFDVPSVIFYYQGFPQCTGPLYLNKTVYEKTGNCMYNEGRMLFVYAKEPGNPMSIVPREALLHLAGILGKDNVDEIPDCDITGYGRIEEYHDSIVRNLESTAKFCKKLYLFVPDEIKSKLQLDEGKFIFTDTDDMNKLRSMADTTFLWKVDSHDFIPDDMADAVKQIAYTLPDEIDSIDIGRVFKIKGSVVICDPDTISVTKLSRRSSSIVEMNDSLWKHEEDKMIPLARIQFINGQSKEILAHQQQGPIFMQRLLSGMPGNIPVIVNDVEEGNEDLLKQDNVYIGSYSRSSI